MKKTKVKNKKLPEFEFGTYVENPSTTLYENQLALMRASQSASNNDWVKGTKMFGNLAMKVGSSMMNSKGAGQSTPGGGEVATEGFGGSMNGFFGNNQGDTQSGLNMMNIFGNSGGFAFGGEVPGVPVEVEGEEVGESPSGQMMEFFGPSHEKGGIPITLPEGTDIYSKRIKIDGVSMADRKKKREKKSITLEELLSKNATDALIKNSATRTKQVNDKEEASDNNIQQLIKTVMGGQKHAFGGGVYGPSPYNFRQPTILNNYGQEVPDPNFVPNLGTPNEAGYPSFANNWNGNQYPTTSYNPASTPSTVPNGEQANPLKDMLGGLTLGDAMGLYGNYVSTFEPMKNTKANRAGDTPNINAFKDFGKEGLKTLDKSKRYVNQIRDEKLGDLELSRTASIKRNNNSARGVNAQRALNLATDMGINENQDNVYNAFAEQMMNIFGQEAGMLNQKDQIVMGGEQNRDNADRMDRDNYYSNLAQDIATKGTGLQETGKDVNQIKQREVMQNLLNQLSAYGITIDSSGNLSNKK